MPTKPILDADTLEHVRELHKHAEQAEWTSVFDSRYQDTYHECDSCGATHWSNKRDHRPGCKLEAALKSMGTFLDVEDTLHRELGDEG